MLGRTKSTIIILSAVVAGLMMLSTTSIVFKKATKYFKETRPPEYAILTSTFEEGSIEDEKFNEMIIDFYAMENMARNILPIDTLKNSTEQSLSDIKYWLILLG